MLYHTFPAGGICGYTALFFSAILIPHTTYAYALPISCCVICTGGPGSTPLLPGKLPAISALLSHYPAYLPFSLCLYAGGSLFYYYSFTATCHTHYWAATLVQT